MALARDGRTLVAVYGRNHGGIGPYLKVSNDGGLSWDEERQVLRFNDDNNYSPVHETRNHSILTFDLPHGCQRHIVFGVGVGDQDEQRKLHQWVSEGGNMTWVHSLVNGIARCEYAPRSMAQLDDGRHLVLFHTVEGTCNKNGKRRIKSATWEATSRDSGITWETNTKRILLSDDDGFCEPCLFQSGNIIVALLRAYNNGHRSAWIQKTETGWSKPRQLPNSLNGDAHITSFGKEEAKLVVCFRQSRDQAKQNANDTGGQPHQYFVAWSGAFEDILEGRNGDALAVLVKNDGYDPQVCNSGNSKFQKGDCGYAGLAQLDDGTFVSVVHSTLTDQGDKCPSIYCVRFTLSDIQASNG